MAGSNINRVIITGNLTRDPEMTAIPSTCNSVVRRDSPQPYAGSRWPRPDCPPTGQVQLTPRMRQ